MNFQRILLTACLLLAPLAAFGQAPDAKRIIEGARMSATLTELDGPLNGTLSKGGKRTPIALFLKGKNIQFQFSEKANEWRVFHMRLADNKYDLFEMINGKTVQFPPAKLIEPIAATDLTYEDLAFRFFYWPNPKFEGEENVAGQPCYKIRLDKPRGAAGRYEAVYVWVHTKFGAFMKIRGHDAAGGLVKEFQVEDVMQVSKDVWTLRKMQVSSHDPKTERRLSISSVTFDTPKKASIRGPR